MLSRRSASSKCQSSASARVADLPPTSGLSELVDDEPKEIRLPIIVPQSSAAALRVNYINEQCKKTHNVEIVGWLVTTVVLDSGLDEDHEKCVTSFELFRGVGSQDLADIRALFSDTR